MGDLWVSNDLRQWQSALECYAEVITGQSIEHLPELDQWYHRELPALIRARTPAHITHEELVRVTEWKMKRGVWRGRNLALVKSNDPDLVIEKSSFAFETTPHPTRPIAALSELSGVGAATASAVMAAFAPETYPFFDEIVAAQIPDLGEVAFTQNYYGRYAQALRERATTLRHEWTPARVEQALWAKAGGKTNFQCA